MTNEAFFDTLLQKGKEARDKATAAFSGLTEQQLNWKPSQKSWSIAQCLEHLVISDRLYFPDLDKISRGNHKMSPWAKYSPFTSWLGRMMKERMEEQARIKMRTAGKLLPASSNIDKGIPDRYLSNLDTFLAHINNCRKADLDTVITSPVLSIVTYTLRDALEFLLTHEHRHLNQALRVKDNEGFPR